MKLSNRMYRWALNPTAGLIVFGIIAMFACFFVSRRVTITRIAHAQAVTTPFTLESEAYNFESNPSGDLFNKKTVARRSDGATALISNMGPVSWGQTSRRITFTDGTVVSLVDLVGAKTTWSLRSAQQAALVKAQLLEPPQNCVNVGDRLLGFGTLLGQRVGISSRAAPENDQITQWKALDLACQVLQYRVETKQPDGSLKLKTEAKPVSLILGEPDPRFFYDGPDYLELKPSLVLSKVLERLGVHEDAELRQQGAFMDSNYLRKKGAM